jgi:hypothetical protein
MRFSELPGRLDEVGFFYTESTKNRENSRTSPDCFILFR